MAQDYVFISYAREDRAFVETLNARLRDAGIVTWTDLDQIEPGADWQHAIDRSLSSASALIYVSSRHSVDSRWIVYEVAAFQRKDRRIFPIVLDDAGAATMPLELQAIQWVDFRGAFEPAMRRLLSGLDSIRHHQAVAPATPKSKGYVFLSYADEDRQFVLDLKTFLMKRGYGYWDYRESQRNYQTDYTLDLENAIKAATGTLSIISPDWKRSPTALQELHFSRSVQIPVFILMVRDPGPTLAIAGMTYSDFTRSRTDGFSQLDDEMRRKGL